METLQKATGLNCSLNWIWLTCEFDGKTNFTIARQIKMMLGLGLADEKPQMPALLVVGDGRLDDNRQIRWVVPNAQVIQNYLTAFAILLVLYLCIVVTAAIRGQLIKRGSPSEPSKGKSNEIDESAPKFILSRFQDLTF